MHSPMMDGMGRGSLLVSPFPLALDNSFQPWVVVLVRVIDQQSYEKTNSSPAPCGKLPRPLLYCLFDAAHSVSHTGAL